MQSHHGYICDSWRIHIKGMAVSQEKETNCVLHKLTDDKETGEFGQFYIRAQMTRWLWLLRAQVMILVRILYDQSVVCYLWTHFTINSAHVEADSKKDNTCQVPSTAFTNEKPKKTRVESRSGNEASYEQLNCETTNSFEINKHHFRFCICIKDQRDYCPTAVLSLIMVPLALSV